MKVLVIGGTLYFGIHLVKRLIHDGHDVTIATRGITKDDFGEAVKRLHMDRTNPESVADALNGRRFDAVCDNICLSSNEVKYVLDTLHTDRYILTSSRGVYTELPNKEITGVTDENGFNPLEHELIWCGRDEFSYYESKRQAEAALFQVYGHISSAAVRFPIVIGLNDDVKRLDFFVEHVMDERPMNVINLDRKLCCIKSDEAGNFLARLVSSDCTGPVNASSDGSFCVGDLLRHIESKTGKKAIIDENGDEGTCNITTSLILDTTKAKQAGFAFSNVEAWIFKLIDTLIRNKREC